jgi:hypothetical protein
MARVRAAGRSGGVVEVVMRQRSQVWTRVAKASQQQRSTARECAVVCNEMRVDSMSNANLQGTKVRKHASTRTGGGGRGLGTLLGSPAGTTCRHMGVFMCCVS